MHARSRRSQWQGFPARGAGVIGIRHERASDAAAIAALTEAAFREVVHSDHTESAIVGALREAGQLAVSLVAGEPGQVVGHVAVSPVTVSDGSPSWYGLGPVSVAPGRQGRGIGSLLVTRALAELRAMGAAGCVVLGEPGYYARFGFRSEPGLVLPGAPAGYFQAIAFDGRLPCGEVAYHVSFDAVE